MFALFSRLGALIFAWVVLSVGLPISANATPTVWQFCTQNSAVPTAPACFDTLAAAETVMRTEDPSYPTGKEYLKRTAGVSFDTQGNEVFTYRVADEAPASFGRNYAGGIAHVNIACPDYPTNVDAQPAAVGYDNYCVNLPIVIAGISAWGAAQSPPISISSISGSAATITYVGPFQSQIDYDKYLPYPSSVGIAEFGPITSSNIPYVATMSDGSFYRLFHYCPVK